jgi:hypothetical protein
MKKVTDKDLLAQLNGSGDDDLQSPLHHVKKLAEPSSALGTFAKSAFRAAPEAIGNLMMKMGLTTPEIMEEALNGKRNGKILHDEAYEQGKEMHPIANILGNMAGFGPVGLGTSAGLRAIPGVAKAMKAAAPSLLKRTAVHGAEGATIGGLYSPEGQEGEGMLLGGLLGGGIGGPGKSLAKAIPGLRQKGKNIANIEELQGKHADAMGAHEEQQALIDAIKRQNQEQGAGMGSPEGIMRQINNKQGELGQLQESAQIPHEQTNNLLNWPEGEELVPNAMREKEMGVKEMEHYLGKHDTETLDVQAANEVRSSIKKMKQNIQKNYYEPVEEYTTKNYIKLPRTADVKAIEEQLAKISSDPEFKRSPGFEKLKQEMLKQGGGVDLVPANDFVKQWKETKQAAAKARRKGYQEGGDDQAYWQDQAENLKSLAEKQLQVLQHNLPKEYFDKLLTANKLWREEVAPFYGNKIYEQVKKLGRIDSPNIMKELRGSGMGQEKMKELFLANPKLTKLAIGHSYAKTPEKLLQAAPHEHDFINQLPSLQGMLGRLAGHNRRIEIAKAQTERMKGNRARVEEGHKELVAKQLERQKAVEKSEKLRQEIDHLHSKREVLQRELKKGDITKAHFEKLDQELKQTIQSKQAIYNKAKKVIGIGLGMAGVSEISKLLHR